MGGGGGGAGVVPLVLTLARPGPGLDLENGISPATVFFRMLGRLSLGIFVWDLDASPAADRKAVLSHT